MFSPYRLINQLEDQMSLIKSTVNDESLPCDKKVEIISEYTERVDGIFDEYRHTNLRDTSCPNYLLEQLKERALDACAEYSVYAMGKNKGVCYDSDYESNVQESVAKVGREVNVLLNIMNSKVQQQEDDDDDDDDHIVLDIIREISRQKNMETKEGA